MLFETSGCDLTIDAGAAIVLFSITTAAAGLPAWRASRVDPLRALRTD
jgi:ABC-type antimicrobial peptide transport system permease subunit